MFGTNQTELLECLENLRDRICGYFGPTCDCKYGIEKIKSPIDKMQMVVGEQTGCPEVRQAIAMLKALSNDEFNELCTKCGLMRFDVLSKAINENGLE